MILGDIDHLRLGDVRSRLLDKQKRQNGLDSMIYGHRPYSAFTTTFYSSYVPAGTVPAVAVFPAEKV